MDEWESEWTNGWMNDGLPDCSSNKLKDWKNDNEMNKSRKKTKKSILNAVI